MNNFLGYSVAVVELVLFVHVLIAWAWYQQLVHHPVCAKELADLCFRFSLTNFEGQKRANGAASAALRAEGTPALRAEGTQRYPEKRASNPSPVCSYFINLGLGNRATKFAVFKVMFSSR